MGGPLPGLARDRPVHAGDQPRDRAAVLLLVTSLSRVLLPGYSRIQFERERLRSVYLATITVVAAIIMPIAWGVAGAAHEVIATLLGAQWIAAVPVLAVLSLAAPFTLLTHFGATSARRRRL